MQNYITKTRIIKRKEYFHPFHRYRKLSLSYLKKSNRLEKFLFICPFHEDDNYVESGLAMLYIL